MESLPRGLGGNWDGRNLGAETPSQTHIVSENSEIASLSREIESFRTHSPFLATSSLGELQLGLSGVEEAQKRSAGISLRKFSGSSRARAIC